MRKRGLAFCGSKQGLLVVLTRTLKYGVGSVRQYVCPEKKAKTSKGARKYVEI
jgi:hypothetical protein